MDTGKKKPDRRVLKTKKAIRNALAYLLTRKDLNDITIKDIADTADINRKTFYNYYRGVYQVVDEIENEIIDSLESVLGEMTFANYIEDPSPMLQKLNAVINSDLDFYGHLFSMKENSGLSLKIVNLLKEKLKETIRTQISLDEDTFEAFLIYMLSGTLAVYQDWFNSDRHQSLEDLSETVSRLCANGYAGLTAS